ncbi:hypothetical protein FIV00_15650 [Labrenzia sp. THAF82]|nr:hypothetical protein FIV00_15650 [Labrenzia sp. THAF82]
MPNDAGWFTARTVDYISKISKSQYVHVEIQTKSDKTMHWRMANYFILLNHKIHGWNNDNISIIQFLVYIGPGKNTMLKDNPRLGRPYFYKTVDLSKYEGEHLFRSDFYGDRILALLTAGVTKEMWLKTLDEVCGLRQNAQQLEALFFVYHLSALRGMQEMIEHQLKEMGIYEALRTTPLTEKAAEQNSIGTIIELLSDFYIDNGDEELNDEETEILMNIDFKKVKSIYKSITRDNAPRSIIVAGAVLQQGTSIQR